MYLETYGLREPPFSITPDPRFVFLSERHRDALAHLLYGISQGGGGGFVQLTGEVGTGKTTLCRLLLEQLPETTRVALLLNPHLGPVELVEAVCDELRLDVEGRRGSLKALLDALNAHLLDAYAQGLRVVLLIDEAQELSREALEQVRLLTNLETPTQKLLQVVLLGQPELRERLQAPELRQLAQRITARFHLTPLDEGESEAYLRHRMAVAGGARFPFSRLAVKRLHRRAGGVPRLLNVIAERALLAGYARGEDPIGERLVERAAAEILPARLRWLRRAPPRAAWFAAAGLAALLALVAALPPLRAPPEAGPGAPVDAAAAPGPAQAAAPASLDATALAGAIRAAGRRQAPAWATLFAAWAVAPTEASLAGAERCPLRFPTPGAEGATGPVAADADALPAVTPPAIALYCVRGRAGLSTLAALDRPALLRLRDGRDEAWALLLGMDALRVRLQLGGERIDVARTALEAAWAGEYAAIWRAPGFLELPLAPGASGPAVDWLAARLKAREAVASTAAGPRRYDPALAEQVRRLQAHYGLERDGVVGPATLLALMAEDGPGPRLSRSLP
jgi:general secretion pathway protein A